MKWLFPILLLPLLVLSKLMPRCRFSDGRRVAVVAALLLCSGCESISVTRPAPQYSFEWSGQVFSNKIQLPLWDPQQIPFGVWEWGVRFPDMVVVVRTNQLAADEAEALRQWRALEARALEQHRLDRGGGWQALVPAAVGE